MDPSESRRKVQGAEGMTGKKSEAMVIDPSRACLEQMNNSFKIPGIHLQHGVVLRKPRGPVVWENGIYYNQIKVKKRVALLLF